jgi:hydroxyethylthiazole kinase-like uncharacterized protein yjeF
MLKDSITSREMRALELNSEYFGIPRLLLMENAGHSVALEMTSRFTKDKTIAIFCGLGGNGGDGLVAARHLFSTGFKVSIVLAGKAKEISDEAALRNWKALECLRDTIPVQEVQDSSLIPMMSSDVVVDALLGTGAKGNLRPPILQLVEYINRMNAFRVSIDVPTGIDADTGEVLGEAVKANLTVTFHKMKKGLLKAKKFAGETVVKNIGLPEEFEEFAGPGDVALVTRPRRSESHKGDFGRLLVIGGSETFSGAPVLVAQAALRTGVDLAYIAAPERTAYAISSLSPDLITIKLEGKHLNPENLSTLNSFIDVSDAVALGPGLGLHEKTKIAVRKIVEATESAGKPLLLDADGLKAFAEFKRKLNVPLVMTPHAGEYSILTGKKPSETLNVKVLEVEKTAAELDAVILLKGPVDIISDGKRSKLNFTGNPGMTVGGTGDVLSGIVAAFLAKREDPFEAAVAGAFVNGAAGDFAYEEKGFHLVATDLIKHIPTVLNDPMSHLKVRRPSGKTG